MKKNILFLAHRIPYPPNKGDKIRSFNEIKFLSKDNKVDLIAFVDDPKDYGYNRELKKYCNKVKIIKLNKIISKITGLIFFILGKSISEGYFFNFKYKKSLGVFLKENKYDKIICFSSVMGQYLIDEKLEKIELIMDFCDLDSDKWIQYSKSFKFPLNLVFEKEAKRVLALEKKINKKFNSSIFISVSEAKLFKKYYPDAKKIKIVPNGVDYKYFDKDKVKPFKKPADTIRIMFSGAMDYYPNIEAVEWFAQDIFPKIRKEISNVEFMIVGRNPEKKVRQLEKIKGIKVTGFVDDIRIYYKSADICVAPLLIARGVQNKVLEAMAMAKPVVATSNAIEGIDLEINKDCHLADSAEKFAELVVNLIKNKDLREMLGTNARNYITSNHNWDFNLKSLIEN
ncbi:MAG: TIGR03087 family PEP-CTERM/XrtA system glycosyltransferase [Desulforegulaceae bacterium]|nr:TIGR03087 family PEP-CTERM/XrtA system glycosyltransferase [Desulforegulaceae bacterium]